MNVLEEAQQVVAERQAQYGEPENCFPAIAEVWTALIGAPITARDVCRMMIGLKLVRDTAAAKRDNLVDVAGYAWCAELSPDPDYLPADRPGRVLGEAVAADVSPDQLGGEAASLARLREAVQRETVPIAIAHELRKLREENASIARQLCEATEELVEAEAAVMRQRKVIEELRFRGAGAPA